tara:strand:+ start:3042 stop:4547 length:1506 start_codon:yes stop_codon:yes gene_type:complete
MENVTSITPLLAVAVSLVGALLSIFFDKQPNVREGISITAAVAKLALVAGMLPVILSGGTVSLTLLELSPGITLGFRVDAMGIMFAMSASLLYTLTLFYSIGYMRGANEHRQTRFFAFLAVCLSSTIGLCFAANLLTYLLFYEVLTLATYPLVVHKGTEEAVNAGRKYLMFLLPGGLALIPAAAITFNEAGTLEFAAGGILSASSDPGLLLGVFILFLIGFGVKGGLMPMHSWLPSAMVAPTPVSALLHAVAVVKAGVFSVARVAGFIFGPSLMHDIGASRILAVLAGATILIASLIAIRQDDLKARLAYSTVGHLSYILLGCAILAPAAFTGALFHIATHAAMKITLFFCAGAIYVTAHKTKISQLDGIGHKMPYTMAAFAIGALGLAGMPAIGGFLSKWYLAAGAADAGQTWFLVILLVSGVLNAGYLVPIVTRAFLKEPAHDEDDHHDDHGEASNFMLVPIVICALLAVVLGVTPDAFFHFFSLATQTVGAISGAGAW